LAQAIVEIGQAWEQDAVAAGEGPEIIGAVDETFLERLLLVFLDLSTGYLLLEDAVEDRSYATWKGLGEKRLETLGAPVRSLGSDRAQALIPLAQQGLECLSIPEVLHLVHDIVQSDSLAIGRQLRQARRALPQAEDRLQRHREREPRQAVTREATWQVEIPQAEGRRWETIQRAYRQRLAPLSLTLPPFAIEDAACQPSKQVESRVQVQGEAIEALAHMHQLPDRQATMQKVKKPSPDLAALVDFWWAGGRQDLARAVVSRLWGTWAQETLLPKVYWESQVTRTRCAWRKAKMPQALEVVSGTVATHALTRCLAPQVLGDWHAWATRPVHACQRASSAVEGRNGCRAPLHHKQRGVPRHR
jgi:hypothetical protein